MTGGVCRLSPAEGVFPAENGGVGLEDGGGVTVMGDTTDGTGADGTERTAPDAVESNDLLNTTDATGGSASTDAASPSKDSDAQSITPDSPADADGGSDLGAGGGTGGA